MQTRYLEIKQFIANYEQQYGRESGSVRLLAASKGQSVEKIKTLYDLGQRVFGESYLQEALAKMAELTDKAIEWHFIGPIQSNKTRKIAEHFAWVHSIDDMKIVKRLNDQRPASLPRLNVCIEVNISHEATKAGAELNNVVSLVQCCLAQPRLKLRGLMTIPAAHARVEDQRREFHKLFSLWRVLREQNIPLDTLSMGMSEDFEAAIAEGSTIVRIGTALFGPRQAK